MSSNKQPGLPTEVSYNEAVEASKKYFDGDDLAATVWVSKYALKDSYGHIYEKTPRDMHERIAAEIERIEKKYPNPMNRQEVFELLDHFRYIIPQGGPMTGIGNNFQAASLSNCFVIGHKNPADSYGGIFRMDEEQVQLMKRRGGVGHQLQCLWLFSSLRRQHRYGERLLSGDHHQDIEGVTGDAEKSVYQPAESDGAGQPQQQ